MMIVVITILVMLVMGITILMMLMIVIGIYMYIMMMVAVCTLTAFLAEQPTGSDGNDWYKPWSRVTAQGTGFYGIQPSG